MFRPVLNKEAYLSDADSFCILSLHFLPTWNIGMGAGAIAAKLGRSPLKMEASAKDNITRRQESGFLMILELPFQHESSYFCGKKWPNHV